MAIHITKAHLILYW
jgi:hypothetical protein